MRRRITQLICAVDGGGTGCRALIARPDGTVLARGSGGPANFTTNPAQAAQSIMDALGAAAQQIDPVPSLDQLIGHVGLAGILTSTDATEMAARLPLAACTVSDDRKTSAMGVLGQRDGAVLAVGTGSFMAVRKGRDIAFGGGWGFQVGDQASGAWLGRAVLEYCLLANDGLAAHSPLTREIMARFSDEATQIAGFAARATPSDFATYAPAIVSAAQQGDDTGQKLMRRGAAYLNACLDAASIDAPDVICLTGGLGPSYATYLAPKHHARLSPPAGAALDGALQLACEILAEMEATP